MNDGMVQEALNKAVVGLVAGLLAWYLRKLYFEKQNRKGKLQKAYNTLFGVEDVDTMEGVVEIIEAHEEDIEELSEQVQKGRQRRQEIERKVESIREKVDTRHNGSN